MLFLATHFHTFARKEATWYAEQDHEVHAIRCQYRVLMSLIWTYEIITEGMTFLLVSNRLWGRWNIRRWIVFHHIRISRALPRIYLSIWFGHVFFTHGGLRKMGMKFRKQKRKTNRTVRRLNQLSWKQSLLACYMTSVIVTWINGLFWPYDVLWWRYYASFEIC
jgi:hypothetical protein